jgi:hypothetical protein
MTIRKANATVQKLVPGRRRRNRGSVSVGYQTASLADHGDSVPLAQVDGRHRIPVISRMALAA